MKINVEGSIGSVGLRPVIVNNRNGFFHLWGRFSDKDGESTMAIVEFVDGSCDYFLPQYIKFADRPELTVEEMANEFPLCYYEEFPYQVRWNVARYFIKKFHITRREE